MLVNQNRTDILNSSRGNVGVSYLHSSFTKIICSGVLLVWKILEQSFNVHSYYNDPLWMA